MMGRSRCPESRHPSHLSFGEILAFTLLAPFPRPKFSDVFDSTPFPSMKEKRPKNNRRRSIPSIHFFSQASSGKEPSNRKRLAKKKGTNGCFLPGILSLKRKKPKKAPIWNNTKMIIPWGIPHMVVVLSPGDDIIPIKRLRIKLNPLVSIKGHMVSFAELIKIMQAPDNRAASLKGSAKYKSPK
jgi:hypothetical protein